MCNYSACHRCPEFWARPEEFYPEHFLEVTSTLHPQKVRESTVLIQEGKLIEDKEGFLPYGVGPR